MSAVDKNEEALLEAIQKLGPAEQDKVREFVSLLRERRDEAALREAALRLTEETLKALWDNPEDAVYDEL